MQKHVLIFLYDTAHVCTEQNKTFTSSFRKKTATLKDNLFTIYLFIGILSNAYPLRGTICFACLVTRGTTASCADAKNKDFGKADVGIKCRCNGQKKNGTCQIPETTKKNTAEPLSASDADIIDGGFLLLFGGFG